MILTVNQINIRPTTLDKSSWSSELNNNMKYYFCLIIIVAFAYDFCTLNETTIKDIIYLLSLQKKEDCFLIKAN